MGKAVHVFHLAPIFQPCVLYHTPKGYHLPVGARVQRYWAAHAPASARLGVLDLDTAASSNDPYANLKQEFAIAKDLIAASAIAQGATDGGKLAVAEAYHTLLVSPFCFAAVKVFFANP
jgi:hypothetical protein